jgi:SAM-dependent methyltransferase
MEEITVEKIKARIKENLEKASKQNFAANTNETILESRTGPNNITKKSIFKEKFIEVGLNYKHIIKRIPVLNVIAKKLYFSLSYNRVQDTIKNIKKNIRRIPFLGYLLWWIYTIVKAPIRISQLLSEVNEVRKEEAASKLKIDQLFAWSEEQKAASPDILVTNGYIADADDLCGLNKPKSGIHIMQDKENEDAFYCYLENRFRGSLDEIKSRQSIYLPYVKEAHVTSQGMFFLDAGCGRGEFLSLLQEHGIPAKGVDINRITTDMAKGKWGVDVILSDVLEYLNSLKDNSLIGLSMFQVIEHLEFKDATNIMTTAFKKISLNGVIIIESVNSYCPASLGSFYLDPTHIRPYAPDLIKFMLEWHDFENIKIIYSSPAPDAHFKQASVNYQTYAVVGKRIRLEHA